MENKEINESDSKFKLTANKSVMQLIAVSILAVSVLSFVVTYILVSIFRHKTEAEKAYLRFVDVKQATTAPEPWGINWPSEYDQYRKTADASKTNFGGGDAQPAQKAIVFPFLTRLFSGYAFALDYRDRRGHAYMLFDQENTRRVTERPQVGACLHCHSSLVPTLVRMGGGDPENDHHFTDETIRLGFEILSKMPYVDAHKEVEKTGSLNPISGRPNEFSHHPGAHPVSCTDCHNAQTMKLEVRRPGFIAGIKALKASQGISNYDVNRDASRAEMRSFVCAQCHVEYYCGPKETLFFPWRKGLKVEDIESAYNDHKFSDGHRFFDWQHGETGAELLKAQHPEFEMWSQGIHSQSGVSCTDCHMPYQRQGAVKITDHHIRSPLLMVNHSCQQCHSGSEEDLKSRVAVIQSRTFALVKRAGQAFTDFADTFKQVRAAFEAQHPGEAKETLQKLWVQKVQEEAKLKSISELHRQAQWRLDFVAAENSMGFHAPQEAARILGESIDYFRQAQLQTIKLLSTGASGPADKSGDGRNSGNSDNSRNDKGERKAAAVH